MVGAGSGPTPTAQRRILLALWLVAMAAFVVRAGHGQSTVGAAAAAVGLLVAFYLAMADSAFVFVLSRAVAGGARGLVGAWAIFALPTAYGAATHQLSVRDAILLLLYPALSWALVAWDTRRRPDRIRLTVRLALAILLLWMRRKGRLLELVLVYAAIQVALWTDGTVKAIAIAAVWIGVFGSVLAERVPAWKLGYGRYGLRASLWILLAAVGLLGVIVVIGWLCGSLHGLDKDALWRRVPAYLPWAFAQQFAAQCFFFRRLETLGGSELTAVVMTSLLFAGAHLPNPVLAPATLLAGFLWTLAYRRYRNLYAISIAHAILAVAVTVAVPDSWHHHMRVGIGYLRYSAQ